MIVNAYRVPPMWTHPPNPRSQLHLEIVTTNHHSANIYDKFYDQLAIFCITLFSLSKAPEDEIY